jgi:AbiV family abortive infection protein
MEYTIELIESGRIKILENAKELIEEAQILYEHQRYARTYALSHLAFEELAKIPILAAAPERIKTEDEYSWTKVHKKLIKHGPKLIFSINFNLDHENSFLKITGQDKFDPNETSKIMNQLKNESLYAGVRDKEFLKPSENFTKEIADHILRVVRDYYGFIENYEKMLKGVYEKDLTFEEIKSLIEQINLFPFIEVSDNVNETNSVTVRLINPIEMNERP